MLSVAAVVGLLTGLATIALARQLRGEHWLYALSLVVLPSFYAGFAWSTGATGIGIREMLVGLPYLIGGPLLAWLRLRWTAVIVGVLWLAHGGYDLLHPQLFVNPGVPAWYPVFCAGVDVTVGFYLIGLAAGQPASRDPKPA